MCAKKKDISNLFNPEKVYRVLEKVESLGLEAGDLFSVKSTNGDSKEVLIYKGREEQKIKFEELKQIFDKNKIQ